MTHGPTPDPRADYSVVSAAPRTQAEADELVAEAFADAAEWAGGELGRLSQRSVVALAFAAVHNITGSMALPRGWVRAFQVELDRLGKRSTAPSLRWYKVKFQTEAMTLVDPVLGTVPPDLLEDLEERYSAR